MEIDRFIPMNLKQNNNKLSGDDSLTKIVLSKRVFKNNCTHTHIYIYIYICMYAYLRSISIGNKISFKSSQNCYIWALLNSVALVMLQFSRFQLNSWLLLENTFNQSFLTICLSLLDFLKTPLIWVQTNAVIFLWFNHKSGIKIKWDWMS